MMSTTRLVYHPDCYRIVIRSRASWYDGERGASRPRGGGTDEEGQSYSGRQTATDGLRMTTSHAPAVCTLGCASWDTLLPVDRYPPEGEYCIASGEIEMPGGTSTNTAVALARLGMAPRFVGMVGDDWRGERLRSGLEEAGVLCDLLTVRAGQESDRSIIPICPSGGRT